MAGIAVIFPPKSLNILGKNIGLSYAVKQHCRHFILQNYGIKNKISTRRKRSGVNNKKVLIKGCAAVPIPTWAYMILTAKLTKYAKYISYGEPCSSFEIYKK